MRSTGGTGRWPLAFVAVNPGTSEEREVPIRDVLVVGREATADKSRQLLVDNPVVSRRHLEIRLDPDEDAAYLFDTSTNGTKLNGHRIERAREVPLRPGDRIGIGSDVLEFRAERFHGLTTDPAARGASAATLKEVRLSRLAMVAGDIIGYSTISQYTEDEVLLTNVDTVYSRLCALLEEHHGTLNNYVGDAFFAVWDADDDPEAPARAVSFAVAAVDLVRSIAPGLALRTRDDKPIEMGWGVEVGTAAVSAFTGLHVVVLGDATNVAFRLSALAGRQGRPDILVTSKVQSMLGEHFAFSSPEEVEVKGRSGTERVFGVGAQRPG